ncbi:MAG: non-ribosomal peptide synthetase [Gammaproteobacteria bacterium]
MSKYQLKQPAVSKIHQLLEIQVKRNPHKLALVMQDHCLTYLQLNSQANQFARYLLCCDVKSGDLVPIISKRKSTALIAMLGILKAGAAYLPLNAENPKKYLASIIRETGSQLICLDAELVDDWISSNKRLVDLDRVIAQEIHPFDPANLPLVETVELAYVLYTSGTTGHPKGGMIAHANLIPTFYAWQNSYGLTAADIHLQMAPIGFDVFTGDWIRALGTGATLVLCPKEILIDSAKLFQLIQKEKISFAEFMPTVLRELINYLTSTSQDLKQFRLLVCGSDRWSMKEYHAVKALCSDTARVINSYGLTEATIDSSFYEEKPADTRLNDASMVPIGKPFAHVKMYLFKDDRLVDKNEEGEIYIGGLGVGTGYFNQPTLTAHKFIVKHFPDGRSERLYRTGDKARFLSDGNILFLGRNEEYIKIHEKRVDISSLEAVISQLRQVNFALVIPAPTLCSKGSILKCYLVVNDELLTYEEIVVHIRSELPGHYVPQEFYLIDSIPLSPNGKVDRKISSQKVIKQLMPELHPPQDEIQMALVQLWLEILDVRSVGINHSFYNLGGTSLSFTSMLHKVNDRFNANIPHAVHCETIRELAEYIKKL